MTNETPTKVRVLKCDGESTCEGKVTHIDDKGFVYCATHGVKRKSYRPCRKMTRAEIRTLESGKPIWYDPKKNRAPKFKCSKCGEGVHESWAHLKIVDSGSGEIWTCMTPTQTTANAETQVTVATDDESEAP